MADPKHAKPTPHPRPIKLPPAPRQQPKHEGKDSDQRKGGKK